MNIADIGPPAENERMSQVKPLVLVADDEPMLLEIVQNRLELDGYQVVTANDGGEALELAQRRTPDLIVLDHLMPVADGLEVLRRLKLDPTLAEVPVLMLTGAPADKHAVTAFKLGAMDFLTKPFMPDELAVRVQRLAPIPDAQG